jgi:cbb3-type cytochrome oxidase subunit 3
MPADSDPGEPASSVRLASWRPLGPRVVGTVLLLGLYGLCVVVWFTFPRHIRAEFSGSERGTLIFFGILIGIVVHALTRSRAEAYDDRLVVVNGYRRHDLPWGEILSVEFPPGAPWVSLDLASGETCSVMGIQGSDGARARAAAQRLAELVAQRGA